MKFQNPQFLYALFALAIPIIIHLFNFRRFKTIYFTNVRFLKSVKEETRSSSVLKHLLALLMRLLAITALVFAFAQPYIPLDDEVVVGDKAVSIFIDNSFSMDATGESGRLLDEAKIKARQILDAYAETDEFQILTNDFEGRHQRMVTKQEANDLIDEIDLSPAVKNSSQIISRQKDALSGSEAASAISYIVSDFQENTTDIANIQADSTLTINLLALTGTNTENISIDSCKFVSPVRQLNKPDVLKVYLTNHGLDARKDIPLKLMVNGKQKALNSISIDGNTQLETEVSFTPAETGLFNAVLEIQDYPITFDDQFYLSFKVAEKQDVLVIYEDKLSSAIDAVYNDDYFNLESAQKNNINYADFNKYSLIILQNLNEVTSGLSQELKKFTDAGNSVAVFPGVDADINSYNTMLASFNANLLKAIDTAKQSVGTININMPLFEGVFEETPKNLDLPIVYKHYPIQRSTNNLQQVIYMLQDDSPFMAAYPSGKGKLYLSTVSLDKSFSNFTKHALFLPTLYNIALYSKSQEKAYYTLGKDESIEVSNATFDAEIPYHLKGTDIDVIPEQRTIANTTNLFVYDQITQAGSYYITKNSENSSSVSFNYDRKESSVNYLNENDLKILIKEKSQADINVIDAQVTELSTTINELNQGKRYWKLCIIFALIFLALETLILKLWK